MAARDDEFGELNEFLDDSITLPVPGKDGTKSYVIPSVDGKTGLWAQRLLDEVERARDAGEADAGKLDDGDERLLYERMLGPVLDEMLEGFEEGLQGGHGERGDGSAQRSGAGAGA